MNKGRYFNFSLGPVQEFVGKARRLKDYWTGSYLLSYLIEQAMDEVCNKNGCIIFPSYNKKDKMSENINSQVGSFPNRFMAVVPLDFDPLCCEKRVKSSWQEISNFVWENYVAEIEYLGSNTREIWHRQVDGFWSMQWVVADGEEDTILDIRKNWRTYVPTVEPGDKCTLFGNLQEISGYISTLSEREKQKEFWLRIGYKLSEMDIKEGERLSAIALIKRVFPKAYNHLNEATLPENFPSTTYMSSIEWKKVVLEKRKNLAIDFIDEASKLGGSSREAGAGIKGLEQLARQDKKAKAFVSLAGNLLHSHTLLNDNLWDNKSGHIRDNLNKKIKVISNEIGFEADTYFALLSMDGDRMGEILQNYTDRKKQISEKISCFNSSVPDIIEAHNGRVIYAGGEDVFAILPLYSSINAAVELRGRYTELLSSIIGSGEATISASLLFVHHHASLNRIYHESQSLLDKKAKEEYGRSSLAIGVWNTSGSDLVWAMPWEKLLNKQNINLIHKLAKAFGASEELLKISNSFIYNVSRDLTLITDNDSSFSYDHLLDLLISEYIKSKGISGKELRRSNVSLIMRDLLKMCSIYYRNEKGQIIRQNGLNFDGALLVKFLAGRWYH